MATLLEKISRANPNVGANEAFIQGVFKQKFGRPATSGELQRFMGQTAKDVANIVLREESPFKNIPSQQPQPATSQVPQFTGTPENLLDFRNYAGVREAQQQLEEATRKAGEFTSGKGAFLDAIRTGLIGKTPQLRQSFTDLQERFGTPGSPDYIENPQVRNQVIENYLTGGQSTLSSLLDRAAAQFGLASGTARTEAQLAQQKLAQATGLGEQLFGIGQSQADIAREEALRQQQREEALQDLRRELEIRQPFALTRGGSGTASPEIKVKAKSQFYTDPITGMRTNTGIAFTDEYGLPISPFEYAFTTGQSLYDVLKGSNDPNDQKLIDIWNEKVNEGMSEDEILNYLYDLDDYKHIFR